MKTIWYSHLTNTEAIEDFKNSVTAAAHVLRRLQTIGNDKVSSLQTTRASDTAYEVSSWPYLQAHLNGKEEAYSELLSILDIKEV